MEAAPQVNTVSRGAILGPNIVTSRDYRSKPHPAAEDARNEADEVLKIMRSVKKGIAKKRDSLTGYNGADKARADDALRELRSL